MTQITANANQKGGAGKTTTTLNLGGALAEAGQKVLLIDFDPQGSLSSALGVGRVRAAANLADALTGDWEGDPHELLVEIKLADVAPPPPGGGEWGQLFLLPSTMKMFVLARALDQLRAREQRLARLLAQFAGEFDHIVIDCPPSLDILTDNALAAADGVLIPVEADDFSIEGLGLLLAQIRAVDEDLRAKPVDVHGLVISRYERPPSKLTSSVIEAYEGLGEPPVLVKVPSLVVLGEARRHNLPVTAHAPTSEPAEVFRDLARQIDKNHTGTKENAR